VIVNAAIDDALGSGRIADAIALVPPSPFALVLGLLVLRVVVQSGALVPTRLLSSGDAETAGSLSADP